MDILSSSGLVDWESESYPVAKDFVLLPLFAVFFPAVRLFLDTYVFENFARRLVLGKERNEPVRTQIKRKKLNKFKESAWKCVYFLSAELLALFVSYNEPWFTNTKSFWVGPGDQVWPDQKIKLKLKGLYIYVAGFYSYSIFALLFWETRRSDFGVSMTHHIVTLILLVLSYTFRFMRVGSVVLALHDATDVFLEVAKMSRYSGCERISNIAFTMFVFCWTILRIIYYPFWVLRSTSYEVVLTLDMEKHMVHGSIYYYVFNTLLFCLLVINIYWWKLMLGMVVKQIQSKGQLGDDVRSGKEYDLNR